MWRHADQQLEEGEGEGMAWVEEPEFGTVLSYTIWANAGYKCPPVCLLEAVVRAWGDGSSCNGHMSEEEWKEKQEGEEGLSKRREDWPDLHSVHVDGEGLEALVDWVGCQRSLGPVEMLHLLVSLPFWEEEFDWIDICLDGVTEDDYDDEEEEEGQ